MRGANVTELAKYDAACRMLAELAAVDEVQEIRNQAEAWRHYAHQAKNRDLEIGAAHIRFRAERRLGEIIRAQKDTVGLSKGGRPRSEKTCSDAEQVLPVRRRCKRLGSTESYQCAPRKWRRSSR